VVRHQFSKLRLTHTYAVSIEYSINSTAFVPHESTFLVLCGGLAKRQYISNHGIELQTTTERIESKLLKSTPIFEYINSLLVKQTHDPIFQKKTSNIPVENGSSLNIPITIKIIALTLFMLRRQYWRHFWGSCFYGAYLTQKLVLSPPTESQYKPFQKHVSSYQVKRYPGCFVWAAPTSLRGAPYLIGEGEPFSTLARGAESNPARVLWREVCHD
jgi:hypothetical protein